MKRLALLLGLLWVGVAHAQCPSGYSLVYNADPYGNGTYIGNFCVAKYEMKNVGGVAKSQASGTPWVSITYALAVSYCSALGTTYHLMTNGERLVIARDIASIGTNWSTGTVGSGSLNRGHSDDSPSAALAANADDNEACEGTGQTCSSTVWDWQRRTDVLSSGDVIWDFAGNVREWVDWVVNYNDKASPQDTWIQINASIPTGSMSKVLYWPTVDSWTTGQGIGGYYPGLAGTGGYVSSGGHYYNTVFAGVFSIYLNNTSTDANISTGFRCVTTLRNLTRAYMTEEY